MPVLAYNTLPSDPGHLARARRAGQLTKCPGRYNPQKSGFFHVPQL
jgi:hypothetical protein